MKPQRVFLIFFLVIAIPIWGSDTSVNGIWYNFDNSALTAEVTYHGTASFDYDDEYYGAVVIPSTIYHNGQTYRVTSIGEYAFRSCAMLASITIPNSVTIIKTGAFESCNGLLVANIGNGVTSIKKKAFEGCHHLESINIPNSVISIGERAFYGCWDATSITLGNSVEEIKDNAFFGCFSIQTLNIPDNVKKIGEYAFGGCTEVRSVTIGNGVDSIGRFAFNGYDKLTAVYISNLSAWCKIAFGNGQANPLFYARDLYLNGNLITDLVIPHDVTAIGDWAFVYANISSVAFHDKLKIISSNAFAYCIYLPSVSIPASVTKIGTGAFTYCIGLTEVHISDLNAWCNISFGSSGNPLYYAHDLYLNGTLLTDITIPNGFASIGNYAFHGCSMRSITIPNSVKTIGDYSFAYCDKLTNVQISNFVTKIGYGAFFRSNGITELSIGNSVDTIGEYAFAECKNFDKITCYANIVPTITETTFQNIGNKEYIYLYVPEGRERAYMRDPNWSEFDIQTIPDTKVNDIRDDVRKSDKTIRNAQLLIRSGDKTYTLQGIPINE